MGEHCCLCRRVAAWPIDTIKSVVSRAKWIVRRPRLSLVSASASELAPEPLLPEPNLNSPIIQLPVDILSCVMDHLPEIDMHVLSVTCRALWHAARLAPCHAPISSLSRYEYLCYLTIISRNNPDLWVCEVCNKLHPADDPMLESWKLCRRRHAVDMLASQNIKLRRQLQHRNVQRALKLARLDDLDKNQREMLDKLTMPRRTTLESRYTIMGTIKCEYAGYPKIVQGRFLLLSVWTYHQRNGLVSRKNMGELSICAHQDLDRLRPALHKALKTALRHPDADVDGFCAKCPVDFSVNFSSRRATVRAWHDFGAESTPLGPAWSVHLIGGLYPTYDLRVAHAEGSVRELYESGE